MIREEKNIDEKKARLVQPFQSGAQQEAERTGFTLVELMIAAAILCSALIGLLGVFIVCSGLNETAKNLTIAINGAQLKTEEIRDHNFGDIYNHFNGATFEVAGLRDADSEGSVMVDNADPDLLEVTVTVCWRQKGGRIFGEDSNLNGVLDAGEDNGKLDSPAQLVTLVTER